MKTIGILGGMGPEATLDLYGKMIKLTPAVKDQQHLHVLIDSYAQIPDRTAFLFGRGEDPTPYIIEAAIRLEKAGAQALCMPCNTAHYFLAEIEKNISIPFISIIKSAVSGLNNMAQRPVKIIVMATSGTRKTKLYQDELQQQKFEVVPIPSEIEANLMSCIYDGVKQGKVVEFVPLFQQVLVQLADLGADAMIAACTELPLLMQYIESNVPIVDATLELAKACVNFGLSTDKGH